ncbi:MAG TPA: hypothetical protein VI541_00405 [Actinomycetota bacterium]|nr:hypothetical protein [Actinomycetota bacterium]
MITSNLSWMTTTRLAMAALLSATLLTIPISAGPALGAGTTHEVRSLANTYIPGDHDISLELRIRQGDSIRYQNFDFAPHNIVSVAQTTTIPPEPLFWSETSDLSHRNVETVNGVPSLQTGSFEFFCTIHESMRGTLHVDPA